MPRGEVLRLSMRSACADLAAAVAAGKVSKELLQRYLQLSQGLLAPFMRIECVLSVPQRGSQACLQHEDKSPFHSE